MPPEPPPPPRETVNRARGGPASDDQGFASHARMVMGLTMGSRISGLMREAVCARMFGVGGVWGAWLMAFIIPNLFRRLFGEGAISAAFIPEYARLVREDPVRASRLASLTVAGVTVALGSIVVVAEIVLIGLLMGGAVTGDGRKAIVFTAIMLPYAPLVCGTAILGGMLQTHGNFVQLAAGPIVLNIFITVAAWFAVSTLGLSVETSALLLSLAVLAAGAVQLVWSTWSLRNLVAWTRDVADVRGIFLKMLRRMVPVVLGMAALQINSVFDSMLAGMSLFAGQHPSWLGGAAYPLTDASVSMLFYAQRLYQLPLGVFGIAIATVAFPAMSRQTHDPAAFMGTLRRGLRIAGFIALPATVGLVMVADPLVNVVYLGGMFQASTAVDVAGVLTAYAPAILAYSMIHVLTRAFYAHGITWAPMMAGIVTVVLNVIGSVALMWPMHERGLALATSLSSFVQLAMLMAMAPRRIPACAGAAVLDADTWRSLVMSFLLTGVMVVAIIAGAWVVPFGGTGWAGSALDLGRDVVVGGGAYLGGSVALKRAELGWLTERRARRSARSGG